MNLSFFITLKSELDTGFFYEFFKLLDYVNEWVSAEIIGLLDFSEKEWVKKADRSMKSRP